MHTRRHFIVTAMGLVLSAPLMSLGSQSNSERSFDTLFKNAKDQDLADPSIQEAARAERFKTLILETKAIAPRRSRSSRIISKNSIELIVFCEVSNQKRYEKLLRHPVWPKEKSGVTIGIGYDLGYVKPQELRQDWSVVLASDELSQLEPACGLTGQRAEEALQNFQSLNISWEKAYKQFTDKLLPLYVGETIQSLPNTDKLSPGSLGAIVSLVYNRGANFRNQKPQYEEMRKIYSLMETEQFNKIPDQIVSMKRLWAGNPNCEGLLVRRDLEAALFTEGLST